jgi:hypothetical protein
VPMHDVAMPLRMPRTTEGALMPNAQLVPQSPKPPTPSPPLLSDAQIAAIKWVPLPSGQDILIKAGYRYSVIASISKSWYSDARVASEAKKHAVIVERLWKQGDPGVSLQDPDTDHLYVHAIVTATQDGGSVAWSSPWPFTVANVVKGWYAPPAGKETAPPPSTAPATNWLGWGIAAAGVGTAGLGGWYLWHRHRLAKTGHPRIG